MRQAPRSILAALALALCTAPAQALLISDLETGEAATPAAMAGDRRDTTPALDDVAILPEPRLLLLLGLGLAGIWVAGRPRERS